MIVSKTIANLVNGVSQQPATIRNPTQCEAQENMLSDTVYGVVKRPPLKFIGELWDDVGSDNPFVHTINQNAGSRYKVVIADGDLKVFDLNGVEKMVTFPDGKGYLASTNNLRDFQCLTLGEKTYILNRSVTVGFETDPTIEDINYYSCALVFIKQGDYSTDYTVTLKTTTNPGGVDTGPTSITKTTSDTLPADIKTSNIANDLKTGIDAAFPSKLDTDIFGSVLYIQSFITPTFYELTGISVTDSKGGSNIRLIRSQIQKFADLPTIAPIYYPVQVVGDKTSGYDDYYVRFYPDDPNTTFGNGAWRETWKAGSHLKPSGSLMPLVLEDDGLGNFTCREEEWDARPAGDATTNPYPSFNAKTIQYMFTYGNRLGFLCGDRVIMSEVGVYTNFFLTTVTTFLDSDPIDIQPLQGHGDWLYALPLAEKIILFSSNAQAVINGSGDLLTPKTASLKTTTSYPVSPTCEPVILGTNIIFAANSGDFSKLYEYYVQQDVDTLSAADISSHVPKYIPRDLWKLAADDSERMLVAVGATSASLDFYVYKYYWIGDQKVQSSWSRWSVPTGYRVIDVSLVDGDLYLIAKDASTEALHLLQMDLDITAEDPDAVSWVTHLDYRVSGATLTSSVSGDTRTFTLPYAIGASLGSFKAFRKAQPLIDDPRVSWGAEVPLTWIDATHVSLEDPSGVIGDDVWLGFSYESRYRFSEIHFKEEQNGNQVPTEVGKLTLKRLDVLYTNTLYFRAEVTPRNRATRTYMMTPYILGDPTPLEDVGPRDGKFSIPVNAENTKYTCDIINDSVVQSRIQSAEWTGNYSRLTAAA